MKNPKLLNEKKLVDDLFNQVQVFAGDPYIKSLLVYYLCVRVSGFIENCVRIIFNEYSVSRSQQNARKYIEGKLTRFPNPNWSEIVKITKDFDNGWSNLLKSQINAQIKLSLESINNNRNAIAHGGVSGLTFSDLTNYYNDIIQLLETLEIVCN